MFKSKEQQIYDADFQRQWVRTETIYTEFELSAKVYFRSAMSDLDNSLKGLLDNLQRVEAIKNDRNCVKIYAEKHIDKTNPRIELTIKEH